MDPKDLPGGGPAYPCDPFIASKPGNESVAKRLAEGMTLRDHFAGQALAGLLANPGGPVQQNGRTGWGYVNCTGAQIAETAYSLADEMLKARNA